MKHDSNWPEASTDQIRQNNRRGSSSGAMENTGFCPWLGSDIAGGGGAASPCSPTASLFFSPQVDCKIHMLPLRLENQPGKALSHPLKKNKSIGTAISTKERAGKLSSGNTGWPQLGSALPCRRGFSGQIPASAPAFEVDRPTLLIKICATLRTRKISLVGKLRRTRLFPSWCHQTRVR